MKDYAYADRQALINGTMTHEEKVRRAKLTLGTRYLCHESNHVTRSPQRQPESVRTDLRRTFARVRKANGLDLV